jgi:hypothetical protein
MFKLSAVQRAATRFALVALAGVGLAGCYDVDATITFREDGTAAATSRFDFPRDAEHVFKFYQAILELQPASAKYFENGLCRSVEHFGAMNKPRPIEIQGREYTTEDRFGCGFLMELGDSAQVIDSLKNLPTQQANVLRFEHLSPRRVKISFDFNNVPDFAQVMPGLVMLGAMKYGQPGQGLPNMAAVQKLADAYADAALAMTRMSAPNNHIQFAIKARRIVETNGEQDGDLVRFRWSFEEFTRLMVKRGEGAPEDRVYYAVIDY